MYNCEGYTKFYNTNCFSGYAIDLENFEMMPLGTYDDTYSLKKFNLSYLLMVCLIWAYMFPLVFVTCLN